MRMLVPQVRQRTVLPRQDCGTARTFRQARLGHMIRTFGSAMLGALRLGEASDVRAWFLSVGWGCCRDGALLGGGTGPYAVGGRRVERIHGTSP
jgi:hypothetical protein